MSEQSPPPPTPEGPLSPDGHYRWDGSKWQPAAGTAGVPSTKGGIATIWVVLSLIFCFPLGFIFIFFSRWTQKTKLIVAGVFGGLLLLGLISIAASPKTTTVPAANHSPSPFTSPSPLTSPLPQATAPAPVAPPAAPPPAALTVRITSSTYGHVAASTTAGATCTAIATLPSGATSTAAGLQGSKTAGPDGVVTWDYRTTTRTTKGTGTHTVSCQFNGQSASASSNFTV
jgi:hypothetical protein